MYECRAIGSCLCIQITESSVADHPWMSICDHATCFTSFPANPAWQLLLLTLQLWHDTMVSANDICRDLASADCHIILPQFALLYPILPPAVLLLMLTADECDGLCE